jgi:hypothetical protein
MTTNQLVFFLILYLQCIVDDRYQKVVSVDSVPVGLEVVDTAGQEVIFYNAAVKTHI